MSNFPNMDGLDLFTVPFGSPQPVKQKTPAQQPKADIPQPQQPKAATPQPVKQKVPETYSQPAKANPPMEQPKQPDIKQKSVPTEKPPALQEEQAKDVKPKPEQKPQAEVPAKSQAPAKAQPSAESQPEPPKKELTMDMSDHTIPAGKPLDVSEDTKRKSHEEAEAKRRAEWEAKQAAKKQAREAALKAIKSMSDAEVTSASTERVRKDVERLTRRNMKECVSEHLQNLCRKDPVFAQQILLPQKSMIHCFRYINRKAKDYIQQEMKDNDIQPDNGVYGGDVPDDLCYQWAEDYFNDPDAEEDKEKEETFTPRPYVSTASKSKKTTGAKKTAEKKPEKKQEPKNSYEQMSFTEVL